MEPLGRGFRLPVVNLVWLIDEAVGPWILFRLALCYFMS